MVVSVSNLQFPDMFRQLGVVGVFYVSERFGVVAISLFEIVGRYSYIYSSLFLRCLLSLQFPAIGHSSGRRQLHLRGSLFVVWLLCLRIKLFMFSVQL